MRVLMKSALFVSGAGILSCGVLSLIGKLVAYFFDLRLRKGASLLEEVSPGVYINFLSKGQGSPTVIFDAGLGMSSLSWHWIQSRVAQTTRTISIDRPGLGCSPQTPGPWLRRVDLIVSWMESLVKKIGVQGDIILVSHSTSGMHARLFCARNPTLVKGLVLVDTAHEGQLGKLVGTSVYNSYPPPEVTEAKLRRLSWLSNTGLLSIMYLCSGPVFMGACHRFPPLVLFLRILDWFGRAAANEQRRNIQILGPHFPPNLQQRFVDEQLSHSGMAAMIAEHGSQQATMEYMLQLDLMRPGQLGDRPLVVVSRDPTKGGGGRLFPAARGDPVKEQQHSQFQREQVALSQNSLHVVATGAGHGSLVYVSVDAAKVAEEVLRVVAAVRDGRPLAGAQAA